MKQIILIGKIYSVALILFYLLSFLPDGWRTGNFFLFLFQLTIKAPLFLGLMASIIIHTAVISADSHLPRQQVSAYMYQVTRWISASHRRTTEHLNRLPRMVYTITS